MDTAKKDSSAEDGAINSDSGGRTVSDWQNDDFVSFDTTRNTAAAIDDVSVQEQDYDSMDDVDAENDDDMDESPPGSEQEGHDRRNRLPPWIEGEPAHWSRRIHPLTALHNEIVSFVHLMEPLPSEIEQRERLLSRIRATVDKHFGPGRAKVEVFGSQATGLFLPTSDIDLVVSTTPAAPSSNDGTKDGSSTAKDDPTAATGQDDAAAEYDPDEHKSDLQRFAGALRQDWIHELSYLEAIEQTRIPLVKFTHAPTSISVDVSFNQTSGPPAAVLMKWYLDALPPLRPLTFVLKYFLAARGLNEPYSGGVGSFMLQLMIVSFLQHRERDAVNFNCPSVYNLGALLLEFFELYGMDLNYMTTGISVRFDGFYFPKGAADRKEVFCKPDRRAMMAMENPLDPTQDVGSSSFRFQMVQRAFAVAYRMLLAHVTAGPNEHELHVSSILATILPPTHYMTSRLVLKRRDRSLSAKRSADRALTSQRGDDSRNKRRR
jgi:non-canonical poly(A) RNA polymerase PAPD5/7